MTDKDRTAVDRLRDDFARDVDIVRGAGGFAPTTADLRAFGEALAYAALADAGSPPPPTRDDIRDLESMNIGHHWDLRNEIPELRPSLRKSIATLKRLR